MSDFEIKSISYENLIVNPQNPRYHSRKKPTNEWDSIVYNVKDDKDYIFTLCNDIARDGLIGSLLPIVMEVPEDKNKYLVYDGNLRVTSIKIITTYKDDLDKLPFTASQREKLRSLKYSGNLINCAVYHDIEVVRREVIKLHKSNIGLGPERWQGTAQDVYSFTQGDKNMKRYLVLEFMRTSQYSPQSVISAMEEKGWIRQFQVIVDNPKYAAMFGVNYSENGELLLHFDEKTVVTRLSKLLTDSIVKTASEMVQIADVRNKYLQDIATSFGITAGNIKPLKNYLFFNMLTKQVTKSSLLVNVDEVIKNIIAFLPHQVVDKSAPKNSSPSDNGDNKDDGNKDDKNGNHDKKRNSQHSSNPNLPSQKKFKQKDTVETTPERNTLIPKNQTLKIDNIRTNDLFGELKEIDVNKYSNTVSLALRSLIEFSVNFFLEKHGQGIAFNEQVKLVEKVEKSLRKLESMVDPQILKADLAWLYTSLTSYRASRSHDINSVGQLNILIHSHKYSPNSMELKNLYNNYHHYLEYLWGNYNRN